MGDSRSKCYDDEEDWYSLKHEAKIGNVLWGVYSIEANFAYWCVVISVDN